MKHTLIVSALVLAACAPENTEPSIAATQSALSHCPGADRVEGIDVSRWQGEIDWVAVAGDPQEIRFAIMRSTRGPDYVDPTFAANWAGSQENGLIRGAYHFFHPNEDAVVQADLMVDTLGTLEPEDLPPTLDIEEVPGQDTPNAATMRAQIRAFVDRIQMRTGRLAMIYTRQNFWDPLVTSDAYGEHLLWVADYSRTCPNVPDGWDAWSFHQYTDSGSVDGIEGRVDRNYFDGTLEELRGVTLAMSCSPSCEGSVLIAGDCSRSDCADSDETCFADDRGARCVSSLCPTTGEADVCIDERTRARCVDGMLSSVAACTRGNACVDGECATAQDAGVQADAGVDVPADAGVEDSGSTPGGGAPAEDGCTIASPHPSNTRSLGMRAVAIALALLLAARRARGKTRQSPRG